MILEKKNESFQTFSTFNVTCIVYNSSIRGKISNKLVWSHVVYHNFALLNQLIKFQRSVFTDCQQINNELKLRHTICSISFFSWIFL